MMTFSCYSCSISLSSELRIIEMVVHFSWFIATCFSNSWNFSPNWTPFWKAFRSLCFCPFSTPFHWFVSKHFHYLWCFILLASSFLLVAFTTFNFALFPLLYFSTKVTHWKPFAFPLSITLANDYANEISFLFNNNKNTSFIIILFRTMKKWILAICKPKCKNKTRKKKMMIGYITLYSPYNEAHFTYYFTSFRINLRRTVL